MEYELIIIAFITAITWLISLRIYLNNNAKAVGLWKGRYMTLASKRQTSEKKEDLTELINVLPSEFKHIAEDMLKDIPQEYIGIAKLILKNPKMIEWAIERFKPKVLGEAL